MKEAHAHLHIIVDNSQRVWHTDAAARRLRHQRMQAIGHLHGHPPASRHFCAQIAK